MTTFFSKKLTVMIYYFQKPLLPLIYGSSNIPDKNSKIRRKFYYLEKLNSGPWTFAKTTTPTNFWK
jgi:hypothetical protein